MFKNSRSRKVWVKSFLSVPSARRAVAGITKKTNNLVQNTRGSYTKYSKSVKMVNAKGMRYKNELRRINKRRY
jgi:hypothetical protein